MSEQHVESMAEYLALTSGDKWRELGDERREDYRGKARDTIAAKARRETRQERTPSPGG